MNDATQQGVSKTPAENKAEQEAAVKEVRQDTIKERVGEVQDLAEMHKARRAADLGEQSAGEDNDQVSYEDDKPEPSKPAEKTQNQSVDTKAEKSDDMVTLTIDGEEKEVPRSKVIEAGQRTLQKEYTADVRLEKATQILEDAKATAEQIKKPGSSQPSSSQQDVDDTSVDSKVDVRELAETLVDGDVDKVAETLEQIGIGRQQATHVQNMNPDQVYGMVESALQMKTAMDLFQQPAESGGYGDLYSDETMRQMVFDKETALANESNPKPPAERLKVAAEEVRAWRNGLVESAGGSVVNFDTRKDQKAQAKSTPESGGGRVAPETDERPKSRADVRREALQKMSRSRGQNID